MLLYNSGPLPKTPKKIISLVPSITELLYDLGLESETVAITKFCIHPAEWFRNKPKIGGTKNINIKRITELQPDLIIANKEENVKEQIEELAASCNVLLTDVNSIDDAFAMIKNIGTITNRVAASKKMLLEIKKDFAKLSVAKPAIKTAYIIWRTPYMAAGGDTFINDMLNYCGLQNVFAGLKRYPKITEEDIKASGCKLILLSTEPYPFKEKHMAALQQNIPQAKVVLADGEMFSWYGSRMLQMPNYISGLLKTVKSQ